MIRKPCILSLLAIFLVGYAPCDATADVISGSDEGYVFVRPPVIERHDVFRNGKIHDVYHAYGFFVSDNPDSPFYRATYYSQGTVITDPDGNELGEVAVITIVRPDGSASWVYVMSLHNEGPIEFYFCHGIGKWRGITGGGTFEESSDRRTDGGRTTNWNVQWKVEGDKPQTISGPLDEGPFPGKSAGYTFTGLHLTEETVDLGTGLLLYENNQSGKVVMDEPDDPFQWTDGYYQGTTIRDEEGKQLSDVGIKSYTRGDGESIWIAHSWTYEEGGGQYRIIGGTGKWKGIRGRGWTAGSTKRADPTHLGRFEFEWRLVE